jgi:hypothetical protein
MLKTIMTHIPMVVEINNKAVKVISMQFKEWVEKTPLFNAIKNNAGTGLIIELPEYDTRFKLDGVSKVEKAEELPIEILQEFWRNSPFYIQEYDNLKNKQHDNSSDEDLW